MTRRLRTLMAALALAMAPLAQAANAPARHCVILAAEYETQGIINGQLMDSLRANARALQGRLLQRLQSDKLVANTVFIDVDDRPTTTVRVNHIRAATGCDTVVHLRNVLWISSIGSAFGVDLVVDRSVDGPMTKVWSRQYRYGVDAATLAAFSFDAFADSAWAELRSSGVLDIDREAKPVDAAVLRAEYDAAPRHGPRTCPSTTCATSCARPNSWASP